MARSKMRKLEQAHVAFMRTCPRLYKNMCFECNCRACEILEKGKQ